MLKHSTNFLTEYGKRLFKTRCQASSDGYPDDGKWYHKMATGFVSGDKYTVLRVRMVGEMPMIQEYKDIPYAKD